MDEPKTDDAKPDELEQLARRAARAARQKKRVAQALLQVSGSHPAVGRTALATSSAPTSAPVQEGRAHQSKRSRRAARKGGDV
jgi:hypothetical protein